MGKQSNNTTEKELCAAFMGEKKYERKVSELN
jgi:hypothetical protein